MSKVVIDVAVPGWRHPALVSVTQESRLGRLGPVSYVVAPFTGDEPEPELPDNWGWRANEASEVYEARRREIGWVRKEWASARFLRLFKALYKHGPDGALLEEVLREDGDRRSGRRMSGHPLAYSSTTAGEVWAAFAAARDELTAAYQAMKSQPDNMWKAGLGRIVDATAAAEEAAGKWDGLAQFFWKIAYWYNGTFSSSFDEPGEVRALREVAKKAGVDAEEWLVACPDEYDLPYPDEYDLRYCTAATARGQVAAIVNRGKKWLAGVDVLGKGR
jgi:hypothetical protein